MNCSRVQVTKHYSGYYSRWLRKKRSADVLEASKNSRSAVRARRGAGAGRCVELDPALMTVTLTRGAGHYTEEGNTIKVGTLYTQLRLDR